jgi:hypothetical protein
MTDTKQLEIHGSNVMCNTADEAWTKCQVRHCWGQDGQMSVIKQLGTRGPNVTYSTVGDKMTKCQLQKQLGTRGPNVRYNTVGVYFD